MTTIKLRHDTAANWTAANPILAVGEPGIETDTDKAKYGDGATTWNLLPYASGTTWANIRDITNANGPQQIALGQLAGNTGSFVGYSLNSVTLGNTSTPWLKYFAVGNGGVEAATEDGINWYQANVYTPIPGAVLSGTVTSLSLIHI